MTENEAIKAIQNDLEWHSKELKPAYKEVLRMAIQALEEIQAYREIGTIDEFKALKEKVEPKKPLPKGTHKGIDNFYCPNCNHPLTNRHEQCELPYCDICGQKLDWSE